MSLDTITTTTFVLTYGYALTNTLATADYATIPSTLGVLGEVLVLTLAFGGTTAFLIWLDHTYYPHLQDRGDQA